MDSVRFGRALGIGARAAAKTLVAAADAAKAPNPSAPSPQTSPASPATESRATVVGTRAGQKAAKATAQIRDTGTGVKHGGKRFGEAVWGPFVKLSGVLWLEITGVFFGIFAVFAGTEVWRARGDLHASPSNHDARMHMLGTLAMALVFGYFCISSFIKANRRGKRR